MLLNERNLSHISRFLHTFPFDRSWPPRCWPKVTVPERDFHRSHSSHVRPRKPIAPFTPPAPTALINLIMENLFDSIFSSDCFPFSVHAHMHAYICAHANGACNTGQLVWVPVIWYGLSRLNAIDLHVMRMYAKHTAICFVSQDVAFLSRYFITTQIIYHIKSCI